MRFALIWATVLLVFIIGDMIMVPRVILPFVEARIGDIMLEDVRLGAAAFFYLLYPAGVVHFAAGPGAADGRIARAGLQGALLGLLAYGTYEATNLATLKGWEWSMLALDMSWGAVITGLAAAAGAAAGRRVFGR